MNEQYWNPEINDELEGILIDKLNNIGIYKNKLYKIQVGDKIVNVWGKAQLDMLMETTHIGDKILIRYMGLKSIHDYKMKIYELEILNE